jgi:hypothetical protein
MEDTTPVGKKTISGKRSRYQTYVFDSGFNTDEATNKKWRDVLGPEYNGGVPTAWMDGHGLRAKDLLLAFVEKIRDDGDMMSKEQIIDEAEALLESHYAESR